VQYLIIINYFPDKRFHVIIIYVIHAWSLGRLAHTRGKEDKANQYVGGTLFVDFATNYIFHQHQANLTAASTVRSIHAHVNVIFWNMAIKFKDIGQITIHFNLNYGQMIVSSNNNSILHSQVLVLNIKIMWNVINK
jgi:hypothetical protein